MAPHQKLLWCFMECLCSVLRPLLFTAYVQLLIPVIYHFGLQYHIYGNDTQLLTSGPACQHHNLFTSTQQIFSTVKHWMLLKFSGEKTEIIQIPLHICLNITYFLRIHHHFLPVCQNSWSSFRHIVLQLSFKIIST